MATADEGGTAQGNPGRAPYRVPVGELLRSRNWAVTALGPMQDWPAGLRFSLDLLLASEAQICLFWGDDYLTFYNDAFVAAIGGKHPAAFGRPARQCWGEIWDEFEPLLARVRAGETLSARDREFRIRRHGYPELTWFDISYSAVAADAGAGGESGPAEGVFCIVSETTARVLAERRQRFLLELGDRLRQQHDPRGVMETAMEMLGRHLDTGRVGYSEIDPESAVGRVVVAWNGGKLPEFSGAYDRAGFGSAMVEAVEHGGVVRINDVSRSRLPPENVAAFLRHGIGAYMAVRLMRGGKPVAVFFVHNATPRLWTESEAALAREVSERTWEAAERVRAEAALGG